MEPSVMERYYNLEAKLSQESLKQGKKVQVIRKKKIWIVQVLEQKLCLKGEGVKRQSAQGNNSKFL